MICYRCAGYWKARQEDANACAQRLSHFLSLLSSCDAVFLRWFERSESQSKSIRREVQASAKEHLLSLLLRGRHRRDTNRSTIEELGFAIGLWNGQGAPKSVGLSITCGLFDSGRGIGGNSVMLELPEDLGDLQDSSRTARILAAIIKAWEPDWAGVFSTKAMDVRPFSPEVPFVDWMLYVSNKTHSIDSLPASSLLFRVDEGKSIIIVQQEPPRPDDETTIRSVRAVEQALRLA